MFKARHIGCQSVCIEYLGEAGFDEPKKVVNNSELFLVNGIRPAKYSAATVSCPDCKFESGVLGGHWRSYLEEAI